MRAYERLINYVKIMTPSDESSETTPSSVCQFNLAKALVEELRAFGVADARVDDKCYVYGSLPATPGMETRPALGLIAHMDTVSDFADRPVNPIVHENYDGCDLVLGDSGRVLEVSKFPWLADMRGQTLITSDGNTILGADDKAGIAEIMTLVERIAAEKIPHGRLCIGFTPDEEIGRGADYFDVAGFGAEYAYTVDGGLAGGIEFENFNAAAAHIVFHGYNVHPGSSKNLMINAALLACRFNEMLPADQTPRETEGYEGFFHLVGMSGEVAEATLDYIIRDHDAQKFEEKKAKIAEISDELNKIYGAGTVEYTLRDQYRNMREKLAPCMFLIENAKKAAVAAGLTPSIEPIRGGTDGARLSFMGLPCPNLGTGGGAGHGPYEHASAEAMDAIVDMLENLIKM
jgi:tripeptide aminopeptidase